MAEVHDQLVELLIESLGDEHNILFNSQGSLGVAVNIAGINLPRKNPLDLRSCNIGCLPGHDVNSWLILDAKLLTDAFVLASKRARNEPTTQDDEPGVAAEPVPAKEGLAEVLHLPPPDDGAFNESGLGPSGSVPGGTGTEQPATEQQLCGITGGPRESTGEPPDGLDHEVPVADLASPTEPERPTAS